jgi:hypothetical protein
MCAAKRQLCLFHTNFDHININLKGVIDLFMGHFTFLAIERSNFESPRGNCLLAMILQ